MKIVFCRLHSYHNCIGQIKDIVIGHLYTAAQFVVKVSVQFLFLVIIKDVPAHRRQRLLSNVAEIVISNDIPPKLTIHSTQISFGRDDDFRNKWKKKTWGDGSGTSVTQN
jgi:hypothetical protein